MLVHTLNFLGRQRSALVLPLVHYHFLAGLRFLDCLVVQRNQYFVEVRCGRFASPQLGDRADATASRLVGHDGRLYQERIAAPSAEVEEVAYPKLIETKRVVPHLYQVVLQIKPLQI